MSTVEVDRRGAIAVLTLNRPEVLNAVNQDLSVQLGAAIDLVESDPGIRAAVLTGSGRAFCAGADLTELASTGKISIDEHPEWGFAGITRRQVDKPLIAAVNGPAFGGGAEIVLACDLVVMDEEAQLGLSEVRVGLFAAAGGLVRLPDQIPPKLAMEIALTGEPLTAEAAARWGLANRIAPAGTALDVAMTLAQRIARNAPLAVAASKKIMNSRSWEVNDREVGDVFESIDAAEGMRAFVEKRAPSWSNR